MALLVLVHSYLQFNDNISQMKYIHKVIILVIIFCININPQRTGGGALWPPRLSRLVIMERGCFFQGTNIL